MDEISGKTKVLGLIGHPVAHSLSPTIHNIFAKALKQDTAYVVFDVTPSNLQTAINGSYALGISGLNITYPHKTHAAELAVSLDILATQAAAVNTLKHTPHGYVGYNTDILGVERVLTRHNITPNSATIIGAGAAATAAAIACVRLGTSHLTIINRTKKNAKTLASRLKMYYNVDIDVREAHDLGALQDSNDICIIATAFDAPDVAVAQKEYNAILNMNYHGNTSLYTTAKVVISGIEVLVHQAAAAYEIFCDDAITISHGVVNDIINALQLTGGK